MPVCPVGENRTKSKARKQTWKGGVMPKREVRRSPENYRRTPTKGNYIVSVMEVLQGITLAAIILFAAPVLELVVDAICGC